MRRAWRRGLAQEQGEALAQGAAQGLVPDREVAQEEARFGPELPVVFLEELQVDRWEESSAA